MAGIPGNRGGGRKSAYQERQDAEWLASVWTGDIDRAALAAKVASKRHSVRDVYLFKALMGNDKILASMADKILPDKIDLNSNAILYTPEEVEMHLAELRRLEEEENAHAQESQAAE